MKIFDTDAENTFYKKGFPQIKTVKTYIDRFMTGDWFFPFCGAFAFAAWTAGRYWPYALHTAVSLFALAIAYTLFFGQSTAPAVPVIAMTVYMLPLGFKYEDAKGFAWLGLWLVPIVAGFVWFFIKHKPKFKKSRIFWPTVAFAAAMPLSGLRSPWYTGSVNLTIIFYFMLMYPFVAVLLFNTSKLTLEYVAKTIVTAGAVVVLEMIVYYAGAEDFQATFSGKQLGLGWGISNDVSVVVMMAVPAAFYLALGAGKADAAYLAAAFVFLFATAFTMSRGCILLLAAALPFLIWAYLAQSAPETRKRRAWTVAAVAGA
ncbi:MAG: hypothetical protein LBL66_01840, partial [Clostridiales bacterium]|nr:hypothetical protein [Clostridiales bacterium]